MAHLCINFEVELVEAVKGVKSGFLSLKGEADNEHWGRGYLWYSHGDETGERIFNGFIDVGPEAVLGCMLMLATGRGVEITATGRPFRYREALTHSVSWCVADHPDREDM